MFWHQEADDSTMDKIQYGVSLATLPHATTVTWEQEHRSHQRNRQLTESLGEKMSFKFGLDGVRLSGRLFSIL